MKNCDARSGKPFVPSYGNVIKLARGYGLSPGDLLSRAGHEPGIELDGDEWELIGLYRKLGGGQREHALEVVRNLAGKPDSPAC